MAESTGEQVPIRVLLVDDQELVRVGFRVVLGAEADIEVVGEAADGFDALVKIGQAAPDVVLMDVQMPGLDGLEATRRALAERERNGLAYEIVILTMFDHEDYLFEALRSGASGFLLKNAKPEDLVEAVRVVARGDALLAPEMTRRVLERFSAPPSLPEPIRPEELTEREYEVLVLLARGASNTEIAEQLFLGGTTVKTHVSRILTKLGLRNRTDAVVYAYEHGIVVPGQ